jgi:hypothetical protein
MAATETNNVNLQCGAHHESGHIVLAAVEGLRLKPEGLMVDPSGWGLACYHDAQEKTDAARERNILAVLAGFAVEKSFREEHLYPPRDSLDVIWNDDNVKARTLLGKLNGIYGLNDARLRNQLEDFIGQHWPAIEALASALLQKNWEPIKLLKSGVRWSHPDETVAKYVPGEEAVTILAHHGVSAICDGGDDRK